VDVGQVQAVEIADTPSHINVLSHGSSINLVSTCGGIVPGQVVNVTLGSRNTLLRDTGNSQVKIRQRLVFRLSSGQTWILPQVRRLVSARHRIAGNCCAMWNTNLEARMLILIRSNSTIILHSRSTVPVHERS
jgi:hypothetical protein